MTKYSFGDIVFIEFYQFASENKKKRPAMVILDIGDDDIVVCPIIFQESIYILFHVLSQKKQHL
ncbi:type II toxin-antitoxin system PemK/MazF family toxin [Candidatus Uabimicrobium sp. HlEnr_7]|uniref:type II toxin-antitoxin system PemK/MazF family toxin n=1 Tax=Candidatus Uabimicrobium helgolandensis TaxID=3095367 RepID=UPI003557F5B6